MTDTPASASDAPQHRYSARLANEIEAKWQDRWERDHTFWAPNPTGPLSDASEPAPRARPKLYVLDMFPYPSGEGLHVGHPVGYIGTDVYARFMRMNDRNVLHAMGYDSFGLPAEQYAVEHGQHPRATVDANVATMRRQLRALGLAHDPRRGIDTTDVRLLPVDAVDLPADLQLVVRRRPGPCPSDHRARRRVRGRHARARERRQPRRAGVVRSRPGDARRRGRFVPARVSRRGDRQLVPRARHRAGQRGSHPRRPQRPRQPPRVPAPA